VAHSCVKVAWVQKYRRQHIPDEATSPAWRVAIGARNSRSKSLSGLTLRCDQRGVNYCTQPGVFLLRCSIKRVKKARRSRLAVWAAAESFGSARMERSSEAAGRTTYYKVGSRSDSICFRRAILQGILLLIALAFSPFHSLLVTSAWSASNHFTCQT
jgi:hypothetical protein